jgi:hypothetical protein
MLQEIFKPSPSNQSQNKKTSPVEIEVISTGLRRKHILYAQIPHRRNNTTNLKYKKCPKKKTEQEKPSESHKEN